MHGAEIFWIGRDPGLGLAIVLRPRGWDWLDEDLERLRRGSIDTLVCLLDEAEAAELGLEEELAKAYEVGLDFLSHPIPDREVPGDMAAFRAFAKKIAGRLRKGEQIGIHCRASIGRSTILAACVLIQLGWTPREALKAIERARGCPVPDTPEQRDWIVRYEALA
jgi:protein-tyrosine phosphatase